MAFTCHFILNLDIRFAFPAALMILLISTQANSQITFIRSFVYLTRSLPRTNTQPFRLKVPFALLPNNSITDFHQSSFANFSLGPTSPLHMLNFPFSKLQMNRNITCTTDSPNQALTKLLKHDPAIVSLARIATSSPF